MKLLKAETQSEAVQVLADGICSLIGKILPPNSYNDAGERFASDEDGEEIYDESGDPVLKPMPEEYVKDLADLAAYADANSIPFNADLTLAIAMNAYRDSSWLPSSYQC